MVTLLNIHKPRDRSHYERFAAYHASFYRNVEGNEEIGIGNYDGRDDQPRSCPFESAQHPQHEPRPCEDEPCREDNSEPRLAQDLLEEALEGSNDGQGRVDHAHVRHEYHEVPPFTAQLSPPTGPALRTAGVLE